MGKRGTNAAAVDLGGNGPESPSAEVKIDWDWVQKNMNFCMPLFVVIFLDYNFNFRVNLVKFPKDEPNLSYVYFCSQTLLSLNQNTCLSYLSSPNI